MSSGSRCHVNMMQQMARTTRSNSKRMKAINITLVKVRDDALLQYKIKRKTPSDDSDQDSDYASLTSVCSRVDNSCDITVIGFSPISDREEEASDVTAAIEALDNELESTGNKVDGNLDSNPIGVRFDNAHSIDVQVTTNSSESPSKPIVPNSVPIRKRKSSTPCRRSSSFAICDSTSGTVTVTVPRIEAGFHCNSDANEPSDKKDSDEDILKRFPLIVATDKNPCNKDKDIVVTCTLQQISEYVVSSSNADFETNGNISNTSVHSNENDNEVVDADKTLNKSQADEEISTVEPLDLSISSKIDVHEKHVNTIRTVSIWNPGIVRSPDVVGSSPASLDNTVAAVIWRPAKEIRVPTQKLNDSNLTTSAPNNELKKKRPYVRRTPYVSRKKINADNIPKRPYVRKKPYVPRRNIANNVQTIVPWNPYTNTLQVNRALNLYNAYMHASKTIAIDNHNAMIANWLIAKEIDNISNMNRPPPGRVHNLPIECANMVAPLDLLTPPLTPNRYYKKHLLQLHQQQQLQLEAAAADIALQQSVPSTSNTTSRKRTNSEREESDRPSILERVPQVSPHVFVEDPPRGDEPIRQRLRLNGSETIALGPNRPHVRDELLHSKRMRNEIPPSLVTPPAESPVLEPPLLHNNNYLSTIEPISDDEAPPEIANISQPATMLRAAEVTTIADIQGETIERLSNPYKPKQQPMQEPYPWPDPTAIEAAQQGGPIDHHFETRMQSKLNWMYRNRKRLLTDRRVPHQEESHNPLLPPPSLTELLYDLCRIQRNGYRSEHGEEIFDIAAEKLLVRLEEHYYKFDVTKRDDLLASLIMLALEYDVVLPKILDGYENILRSDYNQLLGFRDNLHEMCKDFLEQMRLRNAAVRVVDVSNTAESRQVSVIKRTKVIQEKIDPSLDPVQVSSDEYIITDPVSGKRSIKHTYPTIVLSDSEDDDDDVGRARSVEEGATAQSAQTRVIGEVTNSTAVTTANNNLYNFQKHTEDINKHHKRISTDLGKSNGNENDAIPLNLHKYNGETPIRTDVNGIGTKETTATANETTQRINNGSLANEMMANIRGSTSSGNFHAQPTTSHNIARIISLDPSENMRSREGLHNGTNRTLQMPTSRNFNQTQPAESNDNGIRAVPLNRMENASSSRGFQRQASINQQMANEALRRETIHSNSDLRHVYPRGEITQSPIPSTVEPLSLLQRRLRQHTGNVNTGNNIPVNHVMRQQIQMRPLSAWVNSSTRPTNEPHVFSDQRTPSSANIRASTSSEMTPVSQSQRDNGNGHFTFHRQLSQLSNASSSSGSSSDKQSTLLPQEYVQEMKDVAAMEIPEDFKQFYEFVTKSQITNGNKPISFNTFLELHNLGSLKTYQQKYTEYLKMKEITGNHRDS